MPCMDGRERMGEQALSVHHAAVERLLEAILADPALPPKYRLAYEAEARAYKADCDLAMQGRFGRKVAPTLAEML